MRDDFLTADWADNHHRASGAFRKAFDRLLAGLERLEAIQFAAPWRHDAIRRRHRAA